MNKSKALTPDEWDLWHKWMRAQRLLSEEIDRRLQSAFAISKAEFSVMVTLYRASIPQMRVVDVGQSLAWEKSRVSHLLTRMERRGLVARTESGASDRRTGIGLTPEGRRLVTNAIAAHGDNVRLLFLNTISPQQMSAIRTWSEHIIDSVERDGIESENGLYCTPGVCRREAG